MNSRFLKEPVLILLLVTLFWVAMGLALRNIVLSIPNIYSVIRASLIGYAICRVASVLILAIWKKELGFNDWIFGAVALIGALIFYVYVLRGAAV